MDPKGANLASTDLLEISQLVSGSYVTKSITGAEIVAGATTGYVPYTGATQDLDLGTNDLKVNEIFLYDEVNDNYGSTHYTDGNYHIEDADGHKLLVIEDGFMQIHKTDTIQSNLYTSGLTATRDHYLPNASGTIALTSDIVSSITIGTTAITSGTVGRVLFEGTGNVVQQSSSLFWDNTNGRLGIGTSSPSVPLEVNGNGKFTQSGNNAFGLNITISGLGATTLSAINSASNISIATQSGNSRLDLAPSSVALASRNGPLYINALSILAFETGASSTERARFTATTGNLLINTTTDAGFKLDVNGTARVQGRFSLTTGQFLTVSGTVTNGLYAPNVDTLQIYNRNIPVSTIYSTGSESSFGIQIAYNSASTPPNNLTAILDLTSTTKGFLPPRMTQAQRNAIASPAIGLEIYQTDATEGKYIYKSSGWTYIG